MKRDEALLRHILEETAFIRKTVAGMEYESFMRDETAKRACTRSLEVIGEAAKNLSSDLKKENPGVDWRGIAAMRDKIIHHYFGINWSIVWDVLKNESPALEKHVLSILTRKEKPDAQTRQP